MPDSAREVRLKTIRLRPESEKRSRRSARGERLVILVRVDPDSARRGKRAACIECSRNKRWTRPSALPWRCGQKARSTGLRKTIKILVAVARQYHAARCPTINNRRRLADRTFWPDTPRKNLNSFPPDDRAVLTAPACRSIRTGAPPQRSAGLFRRPIEQLTGRTRSMKYDGFLSVSIERRDARSGRAHDQEIGPRGSARNSTA